MSLFAKLSTYDERSARLAGIGLMLLSIFMFSFGDALGKYMVATYAVGQLLWLRACAALLVLGPSMWRQRAEFSRLERPWLQLLRVTLSTLEVAAFFLATVYLPLADVITYYLAAPIFVTALSGIVLGERVGWRRWTAILVGFCGVLIALRPSAQTVSWPAMIALSGSLSFAVLMLITRSLRATPDIVLASSQFAGTFLLGLLMSPFGWVTPSLGSLGLFAVAGIVSVGALLCVNRSLKLAPASVVVPYQYSMIVWAVIFGFFVFGDVPSPATIIGAAIIIGAGLYIFLREQKFGAGGSDGQSAGVAPLSSRPCAGTHNHKYSCCAKLEPQRVQQHSLVVMGPAFAGTTRNYRSRRVDEPQFFSDDHTPRLSRKRSTGVDEPSASKRCSSTPLHWKPHFSRMLREEGLATRAPDIRCSASNSSKKKSITARAASVPKPWPQCAKPSQ
jgi:drug/metabolite transporter (DMT)-like permease